MDNRPSIRIVSDGTPHNTKVYTSEGKDITRELHIREITWRLDCYTAMATCTLECRGVMLDVTAKADLQEPHR